MTALTFIVVVALAIWWYKPLRDFLIQRTNRTVKVLLIIFPMLFVGRMVYGLYKGQTEDWIVVGLTVTALLILWAALVWLGNWLERRRPTQAQAPDLTLLTKIPGLPRLPAAVTSPEARRAVELAVPQAQRVARAAAEAASRVDWNDVAGSMGRQSGRLVARLRKRWQEGAVPPSTTFR